MTTCTSRYDNKFQYRLKDTVRTQRSVEQEGKSRNSPEQHEPLKKWKSTGVAQDFARPDHITNSIEDIDGEDFVEQ